MASQYHRQRQVLRPTMEQAGRASSGHPAGEKNVQTQNRLLCVEAVRSLLLYKCIYRCTMLCVWNRRVLLRDGGLRRSTTGEGVLLSSSSIFASLRVHVLPKETRGTVRVCGGYYRMCAHATQVKAAAACPQPVFYPPCTYYSPFARLNFGDTAHPYVHTHN